MTVEIHGPCCACRSRVVVSQLDNEGDVIPARCNRCEQKEQVALVPIVRVIAPWWKRLLARLSPFDETDSLRAENDSLRAENEELRTQVKHLREFLYESRSGSNKPIKMPIAGPGVSRSG